MSEVEKHNSAAPVQLLHRDLSTQNQLGALLAVTQTMMQFISREPEERGNIPGTRPIPGESWIAAENTLIKACSRIDSILDEPKRWDLQFQEALEHIFARNAKISQQLAEHQVQYLNGEIAKSEAQKNAALEVQSPHFRYKPLLLEMNDGSWVAFLGDLEDMNKGISGVGKNPADALKSFDLVFSGQVGGLTEAQKKLAADREQQIEETENENEPVDEKRTDPAQDTDRGGEEHTADSEHPKPEL